MVRRIWICTGAAALLALGCANAAVASTTLIPTRQDDPTGAGTCVTPTPTNCSLRQAVNFLAANGGGTVDLTNAPVGLTYTLTQGTLNITPASGQSITISGPNPRLVTITDQGTAGPVINVTAQTASISGVLITGGSGSGNGGGIINAGTLTLNNDEIKGNTTSASSAAGGGIYNNGPALTITNSTITANTVTTTGLAGTTANGGGIANNTGGALKISNSTITGNSVSATGIGGSSNGGGIWQPSGNSSTSIVLANVTLNGNSASAALTGTATGGNLDLGGAPGTATVKNTIISGGSATNGSNCNAAVTSLGYNLEDLNQCGFNATGDRINTEPQLAGLGQSTSGDGFTDVETPKATNPVSPVIDHGAPNGCTDATGTTLSTGAALSTDQVGNPRGGPCDIGAFETNLPPVLVTGPSISGTPLQGDVLTCAGATFSGLPSTITYAWSRDGVAISGQASQTYQAAGTDVGHGVACSVTATNVDGTLTATSTPVAIALPPLPPFDGMTLLKTRFTMLNSQVILPVQCSKVAIFGCGGLVKITVADATARAAAKRKHKRKHRKPAVPHPTTLGTATFKFNTGVVGSIPVLMSHDAKLLIASLKNGQPVTIQFLAYDGLYRQKVTTYSGRITAPASKATKKHKKKAKKKRKA